MGVAEGDVDEEAERAAVGGAEVEEEVVEEAAEGAVVRVKVHQHRNGIYDSNNNFITGGLL